MLARKQESEAGLGIGYVTLAAASFISHFQQLQRFGEPLKEVIARPAIRERP
ncbi:hypothetical protein [Streptococcus sp. 2022WUSS037]|uniref:hypothetical protein n=1 Tax=Streptococcus sp. 2022WUSS037 TaxID=2983286 RepID=UPI0037966995